jgi:hypothetical protein
VLALPFPPSGYATRDPEDVPAAVDRHHRRRVASYGDGVCPDCGGPATARVEPAPAAADDPDVPDDPIDHHRVRVAFACDACGGTLACPLSLALLDHPAVVAAYHERGVDVRDRPLWTVGADWRERVLSVDPWCVRATMEHPDDDDEDDDPDDVLAAYVGRDATVVDVADLTDAGDDRITADVSDDAADASDDAPVDDGTPA